MSRGERILLAFLTGSDDLWESYLEDAAARAPGLPLYVVSEFAPPRGQWIPYAQGRTPAQNLARIRAALAGKTIEYAAVLLQPRMPYWRLRWTALRLMLPARAHRLLVYNENIHHFRLDPRDAAAIFRYLRWRGGNWARWNLRPGGWLYTQAWRLRHPSAYRRPLLYWGGRLAGWLAGWQKRMGARVRDTVDAAPLSGGISVVIPSRSGRELLARLLPGVLRELQGWQAEIIVADNGSDDGTAQWLREAHPEVTVEASAAPLSFAAAVNRGIRRARYSHTCLLNNDMTLEPGFFGPLRQAFDETPQLFAAAAQILFPPGVRREETGKAVWREAAQPEDFPVWCEEPVAGESGSPVLYGSGGATLYSTRKLRQLGLFGEVFTPAYVEDLDIGYRGWLRGWPTVFVAAARVVHYHRSTTRKHFSAALIQTTVETNYLRFLARSVADPRLFATLWRRALDRLNRIAAAQTPPEWVFPALCAALRAPGWVEPAPHATADEAAFQALASGAVAVFPGRARQWERPLVLIASPYVPYPLAHGGAVRMYNLMREAARGFDQALVCFCEDFAPPAPEILALCTEVVLVRRKGSHLRPLTERPDVVEEFDRPAFHAALRAAIAKWRPALVQLEFTQLALYAADCGGLPALLVEHDVTLDLYAQLLREHEDWETRQQWRRWERFEREAWRRVACVVTMSDKDRRMVEGARRTAVLLNGVDLERFQPAPEPPEPRRLLFIGSFAHLPNLLALRFFLNEVWPRLRAAGATLHVIAGARPEHYLELYRDRVQLDLAAPGVELEGFVADVRGAYRRAAIVVAPLLASAGTNIKIMEAMAMGKAIVSTPAGINGLALAEGREVLVARTAAEMSEAIVRLLDDPARRGELERAARAGAEARYGWPAIGAWQARLYRSLIAGARE